MIGRTVFVDQRMADDINTLRMQEYSQAKGFEVDLTTLKWRQSDSDSFVMAMDDGERLISTMRGEVIADLKLLEKKLECPWTFPISIEGPVLLLSRAATLSSHRSSGLNLVQRYWFLRFALHHDIRYVVGTFVAHSPRERSLREMGYQFFDNPLGWQQSTYLSLNSVRVVVLDLSTCATQALSYCLERARVGIDNFPFAEPFPPMRYVGDL